MKKSTNKKRKMPTNKKTRQDTKSSALTAAAIKKIMRAKIKELKAEFQEKLKRVSEVVYQKAHADASRAYEAFMDAKARMLAAAEAAFEKQHGKTVAVKSTAKKGGRKPKAHKKMTTKTAAVKTTGKRRGRPPKKG